MVALLVELLLPPPPPCILVIMFRKYFEVLDVKLVDWLVLVEVAGEDEVSL